MPHQDPGGPGAALDLQTGILIDGVWQDGVRRFPVVDKYDGRLIAEVEEASAAQAAQAVRATQAAFTRGAPAPVERAAILQRAADLIGERRQSFVDTLVGEAGFTLADAGLEVARTLVTLSLCAQEATRIVGETVAFAASEGQHERIGFTMRVPVGVVCAITPFNSPLNTVAHKIGPALAAGNAVVLKPSGLTPLSSALLCQALLDAGLPSGMLALVQGLAPEVGTVLLADEDIAFYSFTGSTRVGRIVQQAAGLRRVQLELGSIASTIVCEDADLDRAIPKIANAAFRKAGQVCTSVQRLYVHRGLGAEFTERLIYQARGMIAGDPRDTRTRIGPMISEEAATRAESWIAEARAGDARIVLGGKRERSVVHPTILAGVTDGMKVLDCEIFAPCVSIVPFDTLDDAIAHANNTRFGLAAGIFTRDLERGLKAARGLRFGAVHINEASSARADGMPFGGVKDSGFGREGPRYAIRELTEEHLVTFNP